MRLADKESDKYTAVWSLPGYHEFSPGQLYAPVFHSLVDGPQRVIDIGCGAGEGGKALRALGHDVTFLDLVQVANEAPFIETAIWTWPNQVPAWQWGYCCDVMEHLPPEMVGLSLDRIRSHCTNGFFSIGLLPDHFGQYVGETLHLTVRPFTWWRDFLKEFGAVEDARDLLHTGIYVVHF